MTYFMFISSYFVGLVVVAVSTVFAVWINDTFDVGGEFNDTVETTP